jgi:hypothetical protein
MRKTVNSYGRVVGGFHQKFATLVRQAECPTVRAVYAVRSGTLTLLLEYKSRALSSARCRVLLRPSIPGLLHTEPAPLHPPSEGLKSKLLPKFGKAARCRRELLWQS